MSKESLLKTIRQIPDFPIPGILFYDVTTLFKDAEALKELGDMLYAPGCRTVRRRTPAAALPRQS